MFTLHTRVARRPTATPRMSAVVTTATAKTLTRNGGAPAPKRKAANDAAEGDDAKRPNLATMDPVAALPMDADVLTPPPNDLTLRMLVPTKLVGAIIGRDGSKIDELEAASETRVRMSRQDEVFPGTPHRICSVAGTLEGITRAMHMLLTRVRAEDSFNQFHLALVMPTASCGAIIGKGGSSIRVIMEETGANIKVQSKDETGTAFRLVTIVGTVDQQTRCIVHILNKATNGSEYAETILKFVPSKRDRHAQGGLALGSGMPSRAGPAATSGVVHPIPDIPDITARVVAVGTLMVPDNCVGCIIGKSGASLERLREEHPELDVKISERGAGGFGVGMLGLGPDAQPMRRIDITAPTIEEAAAAVRSMCERIKSRSGAAGVGGNGGGLGGML